MGVSGRCHAPAVLYPQDRASGTHWIGGWVGPIAGLDTETREKFLCLYRGSKPSHAVCSHTILTELRQLLMFRPVDSFAALQTLSLALSVMVTGHRPDVLSLGTPQV
jgi:hypothetical protein